MSVEERKAREARYVARKRATRHLRKIRKARQRNFDAFAQRQGKRRAS